MALAAADQVTSGRQLNQRRQVADLDRRVRLSTRHDCPEAFEPPGIATDFAEYLGGQPV